MSEWLFSFHAYGTKMHECLCEPVTLTTGLSFYQLKPPSYTIIIKDE